MEGQQKSPAKIIVIVVIVFAVIAYGAYKYMNSTAVPTEIPITNPPSNPVSGGTPGTGSTQPVTPPAPVSTLYKDGIYSAMGSYYAPPGAESIKVNITVAGDIVSAVTIEPQAQNEESLSYQKKVAKVISSAVVGKQLDTLVLNKVSGSSLTPKGFNDAVAQIKVSAKA